MILTLERTYKPTSTIGVMVVGALSLFTIELVWLDNAERKSCVPAGEYQLIPYMSPTHGPTWRLDNRALKVCGDGFAPEGYRSEIEIHSANWARQLLGCIALGMENYPMLDPTDGVVKPAVEQSVDAVQSLLALLGPMTPGHVLQISPPYSDER